MESTENMEALINSWSDLSLSGTEGEEVHVVGEEDYQKISTNGFPSVVGKLITSRQYNQAVLLSYLKSLWGLHGWVRFKEIIGDAFLIQFQKAEEKQRILSEGPYLYRKSFFLVEDIEGQISRDKIQLNTISLWIQIYGIPVMGYTPSLGKKVASKIGEVVEIEAKRKVSWKTGVRGQGYMRVKVRMNLHNKLPRGTSIIEEGGSRRWLAFRYERLHNYCFTCGRIGHVREDCRSVEDNSAQRCQYGDWLRASSDMPHPFLAAGKESKEVNDSPAATTSREDEGEGESATVDTDKATAETLGEKSGNGAKIAELSIIPKDLGMSVNDGDVNGGVATFKTGANLELVFGRDTQTTRVTIVGGGQSLTLGQNISPDVYMGLDKQMDVTTEGDAPTEKAGTAQQDLLPIQQHEEDPLLATFVFKSKQKQRHPSIRKYKSHSMSRGSVGKEKKQR